MNCEVSPAVCASSLVVDCCWSTEAATAEKTGRIASIAVATLASASIDWAALCCSSSILRVISSVAFWVWPESALTSLATTAKPRPASPARAASIVALSASRFVCLAMDAIRLMTWPISPDDDFSPSMDRLAALAASVAPLVRSPASRTCRRISLAELANSSVAVASCAASSLTSMVLVASASLCSRIATRADADDRIPLRTASEVRCTSRIIADRSASSRSIVSPIALMRLL